MSVKRLLGFLFYSLVAMYVQAQVSETKLLLSGKNHEAFQKTTFPRTTDMFGIHMSHFLGKSAG
jgi:hypothetical protein